jgi:hypothetical protein
MSLPQCEKASSMARTVLDIIHQGGFGVFDEFQQLIANTVVEAGTWRLRPALSRLAAEPARVANCTTLTIRPSGPNLSMSKIGLPAALLESLYDCLGAWPTDSRQTSASRPPHPFLVR